jgi:transcriptional regulator with XRE-family HTH domain
MATQKLPNYLRAHRRRSGFSQEELAYVVQLHDKSAWCNLERFRRQPSLDTALACEEFFGVPVAQLFAGTKVSVSRETRRRMRSLHHRLTLKASASACLHHLGHKLHWLGHRLGDLIPILSLP